MDGCTALWAEVINRAVLDATVPPPPSWATQAWQYRLEWLAIHDEGVHFCIGEEARWSSARQCVCDAADLDPERFRARMVSLIGESDASVWSAVRASVAHKTEEDAARRRKALDVRAVQRRRVASTHVLGTHEASAARAMERQARRSARALA